MPVDVSDSTESGAADAVEAAADLLLELCDQDGCELSVALIDDEAMRMLNRDWRGKDRPTDVLSFPQMDEDYEPVPPLEQRRAGMRLPPEFDGASDGQADAEDGGAGRHDRRNGDGDGVDDRADDDDDAGGFTLGDVHLGDIVISVDTARRQAAAGGWTLEEELNRLLLHGLLHLLGYDHERGGEDERRMKDEEKRLSAALIDAGLPCARDGA